MQHNINMDDHPYVQALKWHLNQGLDAVLDDQPSSFFNASPQPHEATKNTETVVSNPVTQTTEATSAVPLNDSASISKASDIAKACMTLDDLKEAIQNFEGLSIKKTANHMIFGDGAPQAPVMIIGDAPTADDDREGRAFAGPYGALIDRAFSFINMSRGAEKAEHALYFSNILNWRPPGNRTPDANEIAISLPFIERHIALVNPKIVVLVGNLACKTLLDQKASIMRIRGKWQTYEPKTTDIDNGLESASSYDVMPILNPEYLTKNPLDKSKLWSDILNIKHKLHTIASVATDA